MFCLFFLLRVFESIWKPVSIIVKPMCEDGQRFTGGLLRGVNTVTKRKNSAMQSGEKGLRRAFYKLKKATESRDRDIFSPCSFTRLLNLCHSSQKLYQGAVWISKIIVRFDCFCTFGFG
ncbi:hypothetical protein ASE93_11775 [Serratia sp. Leaf50]|nr:hypothetical protein ASE93_11775 [Serratia sp. Leaf50]